MKSPLTLFKKPAFYGGSFHLNGNFDSEIRKDKMKDKTIPYFDDETINIYDIWLSVKKRKWIVFTIILLSFICFLLYSVLTPDVYKSSNVLVMSLDKDFLAFSTDKETIDSSVSIINMLEIKSALTLFEKLSKEQQATILGLRGADKKAFRDIKISDIKGDRGQIEQLKVEVDTLDKDVGVNIINALTDYVNTLPFIKKRIDYRKKILQKNGEELKKIIDDPIHQLNLPDNIIVSEILISMYDLRKVYNKITYAVDELEKAKLVMQAGKTHLPEKPYKPKRVIIASIGLIAGAFIGIFFVIFLEWIASSRLEYESQKK